MSDRRYGLLTSKTAARRLRCFKTAAEAHIALKFFQAVAGDEKAGAWCRAEGFSVQKGEVTNLNTAGGFVVPSELSAAIINLRDTVGIARQTCNVVEMNSDTLNIPRRSSGLSANWTGEAVAITESNMAWDSVGLTTKKLGVLVRSSSELVEDALGLVDQLASELAYELAAGEDAAWLNGDSTSAYAGITGVVNGINDGTHTASAINAAAGHSALTSIDSTDLGTVFGALPSYAFANAAWFAHPIVHGALFCRLAGSNGGIGSRMVNGVVRPTFWNLPIFLSAKMPSATSNLNNAVVCLVGDMSQAVSLGSRREVTIRVSAGRLFDTDQLLWRGTERVDIVANGLGSNSAPGSVIALLGKS